MLDIPFIFPSKNFEMVFTLTENLFFFFFSTHLKHSECYDKATQKNHLNVLTR